MKNGLLIVLALLIDIQIGQASVHQTLTVADTTVKSFFDREENTDKLHFPQSTFRFYQKCNFKYVWLAPANAKALLAAVRLLSCVNQFGLSSKNYHPEVVNEMKLLSEEGSIQQKEVMFSDALITFIEHLHFGAANPDAPAVITDADKYTKFRAEQVLAQALTGNFPEAILKVQPDILGYILLQSYLSQAVGRFTGECRDLDTDTLKLVALNLERYRWQNTGIQKLSVEINIPAFMLRVRNEGVVNEFKVVVGKPGNPTPQLTSAITYLNTAPDWNVPSRIFVNELLPKMLKDPGFAERNSFVIYDNQGRYVEPSSENLRTIRNNPSGYSLKQISDCCDNALGKIVFRFENPYHVYLHDTPEKTYFQRSVRALSHGCIRVENPKKLLALLLSTLSTPPEVYDKISGFMDLNKKYTYTFSRPIPIYIRYITCEAKEGRLITYNDVYNRDKPLMSVLFD